MLFFINVPLWHYHVKLLSVNGLYRQPICFFFFFLHISHVVKLVANVSYNLWQLPYLLMYNRNNRLLPCCYLKENEGTVMSQILNEKYLHKCLILIAIKRTWTQDTTVDGEWLSWSNIIIVYNEHWIKIKYQTFLYMIV